jgi:lipopolysaccharide exporter
MSFYNVIRSSSQTEFGRNFLVMMSGTAISQVIPVITSFFLARLYEPNTIGAFSLFVSLISILSIFGSLKFDQAILLPRSNEDGADVFRLSVALSFSFFLTLLLILLIFNDCLKIWFPSLCNYLYLIPVGVLLNNIYESLSVFANREKNYGTISLSKINQNISQSIAQLGLYKFSLLGLIIGRIFGVLMSIFHFTKISRLSKLFAGFRISELKVVFEKHRDFALFNAPNALLNQVSNNLPLFFLPLCFNFTHAGYFAFSTRIVLVPFSIITSSLQQIFYKEIVDKSNAGDNLYFYVLKLCKRLAVIGVFPHALFFLFAPSLFVFFFGEEWREAGNYTQYLMPWFFLVFINFTISPISIVKDKQKEFFIYEMLLLLARAISLFVGGYVFKDPNTTVFLYGLVGFAFNAFLLVFYIRISKF